MCTECTGIFTSQSHIGKVWTTQSKWIWRSGQLCLVAVCESFIFFLKLILVDRQSWISREAGWKKGCKRANLWWASFTRRISAKMQKPHRPHLFHRLWVFFAEHCKTHPVQWLELSFSKDFFARPSEVSHSRLKVWDRMKRILVLVSKYDIFRYSGRAAKKTN